jgi:hypothetical protein
VKYCVNAIVLIVRCPVSRFAVFGKPGAGNLSAPAQKYLSRLLAAASARLLDDDIFPLDADATVSSHPKMLVLEVCQVPLPHLLRVCSRSFLHTVLQVLGGFVDSNCPTYCDFAAQTPHALCKCRGFQKDSGDRVSTAEGAIGESWGGFCGCMGSGRLTDYN